MLMADPSVLLIGDSYHNTNLFYKTRFLTSNPIIYLFHEGKEILITATADWERATEDSHIKEILSFSHFNYVKQIKKTGHKDLAFLLMLKEILTKYKIKEITVPKDFPVFHGSGLIKMGFQVHIDCDLFVKDRSIKNKGEVNWIKTTQKALERAVKRAENVIRQSKIQNDFLIYENEKLSSIKLKKVIEVSLLESHCQLFDIIVSGGKNSADPHYFKESYLKAHQPIMIDVFPFHSKNRYFADMTRTFIKGTVNDKVYKMYEAVLKAQEKAISVLKDGVSANTVYQTACDSFNEDGYLTLREQNPAEPLLSNGFIHSLGHGLGLDVHENPFLFSQDVPLKAGNVITIEPGLYDENLGGIRIEDLVLVTEDSYEVLTTYKKDFVVA